MNAYDLLEAITDKIGVYPQLDHDVVVALQEHEVRFASQPNWPFEYSIREIVGPDDIEGADECPDCGGASKGHECHPGCEPHDMCECDEPADHAKVIYLSEGSQIGYLPGDVKSALGW